MTDQRKQFEEWFTSQQGIAYDGMWSFAWSAWQAARAQPDDPHGDNYDLRARILEMEKEDDQAWASARMTDSQGHIIEGAWQYGFESVGDDAAVLLVTQYNLVKYVESYIDSLTEKLFAIAASSAQPAHPAGEAVACAEHELFVHEDGCAAIPPDSPLQDGDKPFCRFAQYHDAGDQSVGIPARTYWVLADNQEGTSLADMLAAHPADEIVDGPLSDRQRGNAIALFENLGADRDAMLRVIAQVAALAFSRGLHAPARKSLYGDTAPPAQVPDADGERMRWYFTGHNSALVLEEILKDENIGAAKGEVLFVEWRTAIDRAMVASGALQQKGTNQ